MKSVCKNFYLRNFLPKIFRSSLSDAAVISSYRNPIDSTSILVNKGGGAISGIPILNKNYFTQASRPQEVETADFNLDGKYDFVTTDAYNNRALIFLQNENGGFDLTPPNGLTGGVGFNVSSFSVTVSRF